MRIDGHFRRAVVINRDSILFLVELMNRKIVIKNSFPRHQIDQISHSTNQNKNRPFRPDVCVCV